MSTTRKSWTLGFAGFALAAFASALPVTVTSSGDGGAGSFREAIEAANGDNTIDSVVFDSGLADIVLESTVEYTGAQALSIFGSDNTVTGDGFADDLFRSIGGADLWIGHLTFEGSGEDGVEVDTPDGATGDLRTTLHLVSIDGSASFGLLIEDKLSASDAGLILYLYHSSISGNGTALASGGNDDQDGVRVNEGGVGGIWVDITKTTVTGNQYDGVEVDEEGDGDVSVAVAHSSFTENGPGNPVDIEDGLDVDEAGTGSVWVALVDSIARDNQQEGFDLNELDEGDITVNALRTKSIFNGTDEDGRGVDVEETGPGNNTFHAQFCEFSDNQEDGVRNNESEDGNIVARLLGTKIQRNVDDGYDGDEDNAGSGVLRIQKGTVISLNLDDQLDLDDVVAKP